MILITTPTGGIGARVLEADEEVRVIARDAGGLPDAVRDRVEIVEGSHSDPTVIQTAIVGAIRFF